MYSVFEGGPEGVLAVESPARFAEPEPRALKHGVLGPNCTRLEPILRMSRRSAQRCWMWRCVLRVVIVRLPGAAGVRNLPRSSHHCSHCEVKSPGSAWSIMMSPPPRKRCWRKGRRTSAEERSNCISDFFRRPIAIAGHWCLVLRRRDG